MKTVQVIIVIILVAEIFINTFRINHLNKQRKIDHQQIHNLEQWTTARTLDTMKVDFININGSIYYIHVEKLTKK